MQLHCTSPAFDDTAVSNQGLAAAAPAHLKHFGFYLVDVQIDDPLDGESKSNYIDEVAAFSNVAQLSAYYDSEDIRGRVRRMNDACVKPFISTQDIFFDRVDGAAPSGNHYVLNADYRARWERFKAVNAEVFTPERVGSFYLLDEPTWNGVTFEQLDAVTRLFKSDCPDIPVMLVEAYKELPNLRIPVGVDLVGFDRYAVFKPSTDASFLADFATLKSKLSRPDQQILLTIDDRWEPEYRKYGVEPGDMAATVKDYYDLASSDTSVAGLLGFQWVGMADGELGVRNMPQNVRDLNVDIGKAIKANNSMCRAAMPPAATSPAPAPAPAAVPNGASVEAAPTQIASTSTNTIRVKYSSTSESRLWVGLMTPSWTSAGGATYYPVPAGSSGEADIAVSVANVPPGSWYKWVVQLRDASDSEIPGTNRVVDGVVVR